MTTTTDPATTDLTPVTGRKASPSTKRWRLRGVRTRLLTWFVLLLMLATAASVLLTRQVLLNRLDRQIDQALVQEAEELRGLASGGRDPQTGTAFGSDVARIFTVFLQNNVPSPNEVIVTFVDGQPFLRSRQVHPYRLDQQPELIERWTTVTGTDRGSVPTPAGRVEYLAVPARSGEETAGVFVVAVFRDLEREELDAAVTAIATTGAAMLVIGSLLAWALADRIIGPVARMTRTAKLISSSDLTRRIEVRGRDEFTDLAITFNLLLDELEEALKIEKQLLDDVGHELRTPITVVRGHLETMSDDPADRARTVALVTDELDRMTRLVNDLMMLARSERPDFLDLDTVDVAELTDELMGKAQAMAERRWELQAAGRGRIEADRQRLTQALLELAHNAIKHTGDGDTIRIGSSMDAAEAQFWITDTGPGVPPEDADRIFERFTRLGARAAPSGSGLGLAIVSAIAHAHRGRVELHSPPGHGATFKVIIPVDQPLVPEETVAHG